MVRVELVLEYILLLFSVFKDDDDETGGDGCGREQVTISPERLLYGRFTRDGNP